MIEWILEKLPVLIFVLVFVVQAVRGFMKMKGSREAEPPRRMPNELEEQRRQQEVQEEIRRRIAERRAGRASPAESAPPPRQMEAEPDPTAIPPLPEPLRRMLEQFEKKVQPEPAPAPPPLVSHRNAELERQQRLQDELKALEEAKVVAARRAAHVAADRAEAARTEGALLTVTRRRLDADLRDPDSLRRAFLLREVLGPPVGLR